MLPSADKIRSVGKICVLGFHPKVELEEKKSQSPSPKGRAIFFSGKGGKGFPEFQVHLLDLDVLLKTH